MKFYQLKVGDKFFFLDQSHSPGFRPRSGLFRKIRHWNCEVQLAAFSEERSEAFQTTSDDDVVPVIDHG